MKDILSIRSKNNKKNQGQKKKVREFVSGIQKGRVKRQRGRQRERKRGIKKK